MTQKRRKKLFIYNPKFLAVIGLVVVVLVSIPLIKNINKKLIIEREIKDLEQEILELEFQNNNLKGFISYLESDQFVEEQARLNLNLKKPGESVVVIKEDELIIKQELSEDSKNQEPSANPARWWEYFFGI